MTHPTLIGPNITRPNRLLSDWRISLLALIALWAVIYMSGLSRPALLDDADTVHAEAAKEMLQRHDWVTLYVNGIRWPVNRRIHWPAPEPTSQTGQAFRPRRRRSAPRFSLSPHLPNFLTETLAEDPVFDFSLT